MKYCICCVLCDAVVLMWSGVLIFLDQVFLMSLCWSSLEHFDWILGTLPVFSMKPRLSRLPNLVPVLTGLVFDDGSCNSCVSICHKHHLASSKDVVRLVKLSQHSVNQKSRGYKLNWNVSFCQSDRLNERSVHTNTLHIKINILLCLQPHSFHLIFLVLFKFTLFNISETPLMYV